MAAVVKAVSFPKDVLNYGLGVSNELFGDNFSAFIVFLICNYRKNKVALNFKEDKELSAELKKYLCNTLETFQEIKF